MKYNLRHTQAVLASTLFVAAAVQADTTVTGVNACITNGVPGACASPLQTKVAGNIEILAAGQLNAVSLAILVNDANRFITLDERNVFGNEIVSNGDVGIFIEGSNAQIKVGELAGIDAYSVGIYAGAPMSSIDNAGTIQGGISSIYIDGVNATITNEATGTLLNGAFANPTVGVYGSGMSLYNYGNIAAITPGSDAIQIQTNFTTIINYVGGTIIGGDANLTGGAINIIGAASGNIFNSGIIQAGVTSNAIRVNSAFTGIITNNVDGAILTNGGNSNAFSLQNSFGTIDNFGNISALNAGDSAIVIGGVSTAGNINNAGTIQSIDTATIQIGASLSQINNVGTIQANNPIGGTILVTANNVSIPSGIVNSGDITSFSVSPAIDLANGKTGVLIDLIQQGGTISGNVNLASGGSTVLDMTGGIINGTVNSSSIASSTLNLNGGNITGPVNLFFTGNTVNLGGSQLQNLISQSLVSNNTFNVTSGSFALLDGNIGDILNVEDSFVANGIISDVPTINVKNSGTLFTVNQPITGMTTQLTTDPDTTIIFNTNMPAVGAGAVLNNGTIQVKSNNTVNFTGTVTNNGTVEVFNGAVLKAASFIENANASYNPHLQSSTLFGQIQTTGAVNFNVGSLIHPVLEFPAFIPTGTLFDIVQAPLGMVTDNSTLVQPSSAMLFFNKSGPNGITCNIGLNTCVELTLGRRSFSAIVGGSSVVAQGVAQTLDNLLFQAPNINPDLLALIEQLELLPTAEAVTAALESLAPSFSYAIVAGSRVSMNNAFDNVQVRLEDLRRLKPIVNITVVEGGSFGDLNAIFGGRGYNAVWGKFYGDHINQQTRLGVDGFKIDGTGFAIGTDWRVNPCAAFGVAGSYTHENSTDKAFAADTITTKSMQATLYGWFEPIDLMYVDAMLGAASHHYDTTRNINIGIIAESPTATFQGSHFGGQVDVGYAFINNLLSGFFSKYYKKFEFYFVPFARFKYTYLDIRDYTEVNAGGIGLSVTNHDLKETITGAGARLALEIGSDYGIFVPEFSAMLLYDFSGNAQAMVSEFLGGGLPFSTNSLKPAQAIELYSLALNAHLSHSYTLSMKYNLEVRKEYRGNNGYIELYYTWC